MNRDLIDLLDPELKGPYKMMISQLRPMSFDDLPAARAASKQMMATMKTQMLTCPPKTGPVIMLVEGPIERGNKWSKRDTHRSKYNIS